MKSPFTGGEVTLLKEKRTIDFRNEKFEILFHYYLCKDTAKEFTDEELDKININQARNQYRVKRLEENAQVYSTGTEGLI